MCSFPDEVIIEDNLLACEVSFTILKGVVYHRGVFLTTFTVAHTDVLLRSNPIDVTLCNITILTTRAVLLCESARIDIYIYKVFDIMNTLYMDLLAYCKIGRV